MSPERIGNWMSTHALQIVLLVFAVGVSYAQLRSEMDKKADRIEVQAAKAEVQAMANDIKTIKLIVCSQKGADSYCASRP